MITDIKTLDDVVIFAKQLIAEGTNVHPDDDFNDYVNTETGQPTYSAQEASKRNELMNQCFEVCELAGSDIYDVIQEIYLIETGLDKFIPLPFQSFDQQN